MITFAQLCWFVIGAGFMPASTTCDPAHIDAEMVRLIVTVVGFENVEAATEVAFCENIKYYNEAGEAIWIDATHVGDGRAVGLFQIHNIWVTWAARHFNLHLDRTDPVQNARLALLIIREWSDAKGRWWWEQWGCQPGRVRVA